MFAPADALVLNKFDLLPHVSFDVGAFLAHAHHVNRKLRVFPVSAQTGEGLAAWYDWLLELLLEAGGSPPRSPGCCSASRWGCATRPTPIPSPLSRVSRPAPPPPRRRF